MSDLFWDSEAILDERYATRRWGMDDRDDVDATIREILAIITHYLPNEVVLVGDYGCGPGRLLIPMAQRCPKVVFDGFDVSQKMLDLAAQGLAEAKIHDSMAHANLLPLGSYDDEVFDLVYCVEVFQHLPPPQVETALANIYRMLRPGGIFVGQFVEQGAQGPHSWPYSFDEIVGMLYANRNWVEGVNFTAVHEAWRWVVMTKA